MAFNIFNVKIYTDSFSEWPFWLGEMT